MSLPFAPPPRGAARGHGALGAAQHWQVGEVVERVLDDISDVWAVAVVCGVHEGGQAYDVRYADDGRVEPGVDAAEVRSLVAGAAGPVFRWQVGELVERLLDDVSDIWAAAVVCNIYEGGLYDIRYTDDGRLEEGVDAAELRARRERRALPDEVWDRAGAYAAGSPGTVCAIEGLARGPRHAARLRGGFTWCLAYHDAFGRCGDACVFERLTGSLGAATAQRAAATCAAMWEAESGQSPGSPSAGGKRRTTWKDRFVDRHRCVAQREAQAMRERMLLR
mmetsp:Transcript_61564/g.178554  ORF Transcript_61564/g.178554 Transcript_61564/m.178554 type:complete len:278 (-) Transcript_61564:61-894(-)